VPWALYLLHTFRTVHYFFQPFAVFCRNSFTLATPTSNA
jgi:hypothetical protein